jgi:hypothetical protein
MYRAQVSNLSFITLYSMYRAQDHKTKAGDQTNLKNLIGRNGNLVAISANQMLEI